MTEAQEQTALFRWAAYASGKYPDLVLMFHIPNGGTRDVIEAKHLKDQGVKSGVPDIFIPSARGEYHGMFIEMKSEKGRVSDQQQNWVDRLSDEGYLTVVCYGFEQAKDEIERYLQKGKK
ncbi:MAG: VRR-NUC domain-containing protein [Christensenella sp.]|nr:VRR-NUC domain-containing protein [Christensenella sp.]